MGAILQARQQAHLPANNEEHALLQTIATRLPAEAQTQLDTLREKSRTEALTQIEHTQLLELIQQVEQQDLARAEALVTLARKRRTTVAALMDTLHGQATS